VTLVTQLSFSGGTGSGALLEMVLRGDIERPRNFIVIRANPGMENSETNTYVQYMAARLAAAEIPFIEVKRNLLQGLLGLKASRRTRFDLPPFWTRNRETGKRGQLTQKCTKWAKIGPMDAACRTWMQSTLGISSKTKRLGKDLVTKWIGFSADEWHRIKEDKREYITLDYPLITLNMDKPKVIQYFLDKGAWLPPRSVCNACFANDVAHFRQMHDARPEEFWGEAVAVDEAIRDLTCVGIRDECFVSSTLIPLRELAARAFQAEEGSGDARCHSGHCFV
jgi:hypothetical protein